MTTLELNDRKALVKTQPVCLLMESFPAASETWNWSVAKGLSERGYSVTTVASNEGDWSVIGGRSAFKGTALFPRKVRLPRAPSKVERLAEVAASVLAVALTRPRRAYKIQKTFSLFSVKGATALWDHAFLEKALARPILSHGLFGLSARRAAMLRDVGVIEGPVVGTFGGFDINVVGRREGESYYRDFFRTVDRLIAVSGFIKKKLIAAGAPAERIDVVYYGVDLDRFQYREPAVSGERLVFVALGRLIECKGVEYAIQAFAEVLKDYPQAQLKIIGGGPLENELRQLAEETLAPDRYEFFGMIPHEQVRTELMSSDILLAPGIVGSDGAEEALGGSVIEAHAIGLPVICSDVGGLAEAIVPDQSGLLVPQKDVNALTQAMLQLAKERARWPEMARVGRAHIEKNFSSQGYLQKLESVYAAAWAHYEDARRAM